jgi:hypothetical protein
MTESDAEKQGFLLKSPVLTIVGSLIGFSGAILTKIMTLGGRSATGRPRKMGEIREKLLEKPAKLIKHGSCR